MAPIFLTHSRKRARLLDMLMILYSRPPQRGARRYAEPYSIMLCGRPDTPGQAARRAVAGASWSHRSAKPRKESDV